MKRVACCSCCDEELFDVWEYWPENHAVFPGHPRKTRTPRDNALRLTVILVNGSMMNLTVCEHCLPELHLSIPALWQGIKAQTRRVRQGHKALGQESFSEEKNVEADGYNLKFNDNVPLGVLCWQRWKDILPKEKS